MSTANIYDRDGKIVRTTTLSASQTEQARTLCDAVRDAQAIMKNKPELDADGHALRGTTSASGIPNSASAPDDVFSVLGRLDELIGNKDPRLTYAHLNHSINGQVLLNADGTPRHGLMLESKNTVPALPAHAALRAIWSNGNYRQAAYDLGLILSATTPTEFERAEVVDPAPADSGVPQVRAWVRWRA